MDDDEYTCDDLLSSVEAEALDGSFTTLTRRSAHSDDRYVFARVLADDGSWTVSEREGILDTIDEVQNRFCPQGCGYVSKVSERTREYFDIFWATHLRWLTKNAIRPFAKMLQ